MIKKCPICHTPLPIKWYFFYSYFQPFSCKTCGTKFKWSTKRIVLYIVSLILIFPTVKIINHFFLKNLGAGGIIEHIAFIVASVFVVTIILSVFIFLIPGQFKIYNEHKEGQENTEDREN
ncbi:MAG: hypothetical protein SRB2_03363 [Desulfobacteraceae bacterium Eth-SRB2]|nr:MAG: hypothetical protein SRB2_03363 [Desulfobacteraceae bacterium Eth-SRB2]